jgi:predicted anti-sigma-YlaC factor YlaD
VPTCRDMSELVTDYMERATPFRTRVAMWLHLWRCEACRRYFDQLRRTAALLGSHPPGPPSRRTEDGLLAAVRGQRRHDS